MTLWLMVRLLFFVSSDIDEMLNMCDRITVIDRGRIKGEFTAGVSKEKLMALASGGNRGIIK